MKTRLQRLLRPALLGAAVLALVVMLGFVGHSTERTVIRELAVRVDPGNSPAGSADGVHFIDENAVREQVLAHANGVIGDPVNHVDLVAIEEELRNTASVAKAEVYHTLDGVLHVNVTQRRPIIRVINADGSGFYIDDAGFTMPLSKDYTARVLVATGELFEPFTNSVTDLHTLADSLSFITRSRSLYQVATIISRDPFWNALFDQAHVDAAGQIELIARIGGHRVRVGDGSELKANLAKLRAFYDQGIPQTDWRRYSVIDTRFADQVVCTLKSDVRIAPLTPKPAKAHRVP
jgi:cell division protein FtsQ